MGSVGESTDLFSAVSQLQAVSAGGPVAAVGESSLRRNRVGEVVIAVLKALGRTQAAKMSVPK